LIVEEKQLTKFKQFFSENQLFFKKSGSSCFWVEMSLNNTNHLLLVLFIYLKASNVKENNYLKLIKQLI